MTDYRGLGELFQEIEQDPAYQPPTVERRAAQALARNTLRLRLRLGLTQKALAARAGMRQPRIANIEAARGNPRFETLFRLSRALGVSMGELFRDMPSTEGVVVERVALDAGDVPDVGDENMIDQIITTISPRLEEDISFALPGTR